ncbi:MAG TPA: alpha/beta hydrolase [Candidatus Acidoferrales bacterium]|jgi:esterase/lipase superfamily enzyme|nr:alpha/beta hydrolase [Candidatus Acidoferrales bacterium]
MRLVLAEIRRNQWVLLERRQRPDWRRFYATKKGEILPRLENADIESNVVDALNLEGNKASEPIQGTEGMKLFAGTPKSDEEPWLDRKVLLGPDGDPVAIGVPLLPGKVKSGELGVQMSPQVESRKGPGRSPLRRKNPIEVKPLQRARTADSAFYKGAGGKGLGPANYLRTFIKADIGSVPLNVPREYSIIRVFYGTDRSVDTGGNGYTNNRDVSEALHLGVCDVTIPRDHQMTKLESPRWWRFEFSWDPTKHIMVQRIRELGDSDFGSLLRSYIADAEEKSAFVFIHGFDLSFEDAARRTAQLSYDLGFKGAPILYSWPSACSIFGYSADEATIEWSKPHLLRFLTQIALQSGASVIHAIAHSMGNRALVKILEDVPGSSGSPSFNQIVLTAPDIDAGEFVHLANGMQPAAKRITLYASSNDEAIRASKLIHKYPRAGESGADIVVVKGIDTIDASKVDTSLVGHSYYADKRTVLSDMFYLLQDGKPPSERHGLEAKDSAKGIYWEFRS